ncbi:UDP-N-acetylmuramoyl-L-alanyl-D-glutamate--2,6-diaminopimelate ligase [Salimicrobium halophilum]|uniref:UDP-N-acetylmuramyl-tripeptide synthetase n=1 Tax=Salimicrobium halophilum TaxID=86666 RepID=A0A1G8UGH1_9BACI|nr:UDP-N-acetylmuramoyl-L-alanyl-D-glutamate--2,6-diaminopimelate ligase [Salimicrobium halophilum]SDJ52821.1 UDP-N-acetylmuramoylalanyl-D-glutamate--2,6-diaminopimelate ligase [Salimicrobium halophilum]
MKLHELAHVLKDVNPERSMPHPEVVIRGISYKSQEVEEGYLFVAIKGHKQNGHHYIDEAIENGACAVIGEEVERGLEVPYFQVENSRKALSLISDHYYHFPTADKILIGVTGTNGKTTTGSLIRNILEDNGWSCAFFGSTNNVINGEVYTTGNTTPTLLEINRRLYGSNDDVVVIEVSSHALTQHRVEGVAFDYALFTNLSHDHLDYHGSMENYFQAKKKLFGMLKKSGKAIINTDNHWGALLAEQLRGQGQPVISIGEKDMDDVKVDRYTSNPNSLLLKDGDGTLSMRPSLYGLHNMYNIAMAYATVVQIGVKAEDAVFSIERFEGVEGRFTVMELKSGTAVAIDYSHTPDALFHCLNTTRELCAGKLIHLFGFRGDRDGSKRKEMISISSELSDQYILTSDDLNSVTSEEMKDILIDLQEKYGNRNGRVILDRTRAIEEALASTGENDWVLITGKGHETYQQSYHYPVENDGEAVSFLDEK